jgi:hypothetical protein
MSKVMRQLPEHAVGSVKKGCRKYERALVHGEVPHRLDGNVRGQFERFGAAMEQTALVQTQVRQVLCSAGVQPCRFVPYYNFALSIEKLRRMDQREDAHALVCIAVGRWVSLGCEHAVLLRICRDVFGMSGIDPGRGGGV